MKNKIIKTLGKCWDTGKYLLGIGIIGYGLFAPHSCRQILKYKGVPYKISASRFTLLPPNGLEFERDLIAKKDTLQVGGRLADRYYDDNFDGQVDSIFIDSGYSHYTRGQPGTEKIFSLADSEFANAKRKLNINGLQAKLEARRK